MPTTIFLHGNRIDPDAAVEEAWCLYQEMQAQAAGRPFRLVIWSWPSRARRARHPRGRAGEGRLQRRAELLSGPLSRRRSARRAGKSARL